jgi:hypothetical protein
MSKAELHLLRAGLDGETRNRAARGELRCALPVGLPWDTAERRSSVSFAAIFARLTLGRGSHNCAYIISPEGAVATVTSAYR